jgi:outer membrane protein TolC
MDYVPLPRRSGRRHACFVFATALLTQGIAHAQSGPRVTTSAATPGAAPAVSPVAVAPDAVPSAVGADVARGPSPPPAGSIEQRTRGITLDDALAYARDHHPRLREAEARVHAAQANGAIPHAQWLPRIGGVAEVIAGTANNSTAAYLSTPYVTLPRIGATAVNQPIGGDSFIPYPSTVVGVGITQEIFDFGRIAAQSAAADAMVDVEQQRVTTDRLEVALAVRESYYAVLAAHVVLRAAEDAVARARVHEQQAQAWVQRGLRPQVELIRAEAEFARYDVGRVRALAALATAQHLFAATVGVAEPALDATGDLATEPPLPTLLEAIQQAGAHDPALLELAARLRAQQAQTHAIDAQMRPDLFLTGAVSGRAGGAPASSTSTTLPGAGLLPMVPNYDVGVVLNVPIYDGTVFARSRASRAQEQVIRAQTDVAHQRAVAAVEQAYMNAQAAQIALPALQRALDAARANHAQIEARFQAGLATSVELADAEALRTQSEIQLAQGRFLIAQARAQFDRAIAEAP